MKTKLNILLVLASLSPAFQACGGGDSSTTAVPRQHAFPRIDMTADTSFAQAPPEVPLVFPISTAAQAKVTQTPDNQPRTGEQSTWLTIDYPQYKATLYCTFLDVDSEDARYHAIANRRERIRLNLSGAAYSDTVFATQNGFNAVIVKAPYAVSTPLQFIAEDGRKWVVSGSLFFSNPPSPEAVDSVAPIVNSIYRHIVHGLEEMKIK